MKYISKNINKFFIEEKMVLFLIILCSFFASLVSYFAYGVGYNYTMQKKIGETSSYELSIQYKKLAEAKSSQNADYLNIAENMDYFTFGELKKLLSEMDPDIFLNCNNIYTDISYNTDRAVVNFQESGGMVTSNITLADLYFIYDCGTNLFSINKRMEQLFNPYSANYSLVDGIGITNEDFINCNKKAVVSIGVFNDLYVKNKNRNDISYDNEFQKITDPVIAINGKEYAISGISSDGDIMLPISALEDNDKISTFFPDLITFCYDLPVTHEQYTRLQNLIAENYSDVLTVKELEFVTKDGSFYNLMIIITCLITMTAIINVAIMFRYILMKRKKQISVFKICGCTDMKIILNYTGEGLFIVIPAFAAGTAVYLLCIKSVILKYFIYLNSAYSLKNIIFIFVIFVFISLIVLFIMVYKYIKSLRTSIMSEED